MSQRPGAVEQRTLGCARSVPFRANMDGTFDAILYDRESAKDTRIMPWLRRISTSPR